jgi:SHS2 domain-containing protein
VVEVTYRDIELTAPDMESLLVDWLNELVYIFDVENMLFKRFDISQLDQNWLKARVYGEKVDAARHEIKLGVKAATYHMLQIVSNNGYQARVIFDI